MRFSLTSEAGAGRLLMCLAIAAAVGLGPGLSAAEQRFVELPEIENRTVAPRVVYVENRRFPKVEVRDLWTVLRSAADLVQVHFGVTVEYPPSIPKLDIDDVFAGVVAKQPADFDNRIGDFRHGKVDREVVRRFLAETISKEKEPLVDQIAFARPYLVRPPEEETLDGFSRAVTDTFRSRLTHWTAVRLEDGYPVIGRVPGRPDLPHNEYVYWALMMKLGIDAEIVLTNQLVASVEYGPIPVHTSIRGGITGGSTEYNPTSRLGASVWVSLFPFLSDDSQIIELRKDSTYARSEALSYAGAMLAHEMGHQLLQLGHPWSNPACLMRPAQALDFASWVKGLDAEACRIGSSPAMLPGTVKAPVW